MIKEGFGEEVKTNYSEQISLHLTVENLPLLIQNRIRIPVVDLLYKEFQENKISESLLKMLKMFPEDLRPPVIHTLATHVTKEKPVFIYALGRLYVEDKGVVCDTAACVDLLWSLSMMVDDLFDKDKQRAGKPTSWVVFGKELTQTSVKKGLEIVSDIMENKSPELGSHLLEIHVKRGLASLSAPELSDLNCTQERILENIDQRASFHCELPIAFLSNFCTRNCENELQAAIKSLYASNRAGQILNDFKDLIPTSLYGRQQFSDIQGGTVTIPILNLWGNLSISERNEFTHLFGKGNLNETEIDFLNNLILKKINIQQIKTLVFSTYSLFENNIKTLVLPEDLSFFTAWIQYKTAQAKELFKSFN